MSNNLFYCNLCLVCLKPSTSLKQCSECKMASYCSVAHQRLHRRHHKAICNIVAKARQLTVTENNESRLLIEATDIKTKRDWYNYVSKLMVVCEALRGFKLTPSEYNMILFTKHCEVCFNTDNKQLTPCVACFCTSYCCVQHQQQDKSCHSVICGDLKLAMEVDIYLSCVDNKYPTYFWTPELTWTDDMKSFVETFVSIENETCDVYKINQVLVTEMLSCCMSVCFALKTSNSRGEVTLTVHVVGASSAELPSLKSWELLLHLFDFQSVCIVFIGPEVCQSTSTLQLCDSCVINNKSINFKYSQQLYKQYCEDEDFVQPQLIACFNCGFHEFENTDNDTWKESLPYLIRYKHVPLVFTSFTSVETEMDTKRICAAGGVVKMTGRNTFSSLRPLRDPESQGVYFNNCFISICEP